mmetsp:Transcript_27278/g.41229  ORF Transcript_27278/g.41229 Transcript_27278/m.41229 type:complete len:230 (+) Transcript_27278:356-1045(+)
MRTTRRRSGGNRRTMRNRQRQRPPRTRRSKRTRTPGRRMARTTTSGRSSLGGRPRKRTTSPGTRRTSGRRRRPKERGSQGTPRRTWTMVRPPTAEATRRAGVGTTTKIGTRKIRIGRTPRMENGTKITGSRVVGTRMRARETRRTVGERRTRRPGSLRRGTRRIAAATRNCRSRAWETTFPGRNPPYPIPPASPNGSKRRTVCLATWTSCLLAGFASEAVSHRKFTITV